MDEEIIGMKIVWMAMYSFCDCVVGMKWRTAGTEGGNKERLSFYSLHGYRPNLSSMRTLF